MVSLMIICRTRVLSIRSVFLVLVSLGGMSAIVAQSPFNPDSSVELSIPSDRGRVAWADVASQMSKRLCLDQGSVEQMGTSICDQAP